MRILLIVDDEPELAPMFQRFLRQDFDEILSAATQRQAEEMLASRPVTHLLVDSTLGDHGAAHELVARWRALAKTVCWAAVFTGAIRSLGATPAGVDAVYSKPEDCEAVLAALRRPKP